MFKDGDVVKPTQKAHLQFPENNFGTGVGVINNKQGRNPLFDYRVEWKGGRAAWYNDQHLELLTPLSLENK